MASSTVSMRDVAALAGVSVGTVSNVLNSSARVADETRARVEDAIDKLGWVRNESARQLRSGYSRSIGVVVLDVANPFFTDVIASVEDQVQRLGYTVQVGNSAQKPDREAAHLAAFEQSRVRGILLVPLGDVGLRLSELRRRRIPVVLVDRVGRGLDACSVFVDDVEGGRLAVAHLLEQGHRSVAFVGGPDSLQQVQDRWVGSQLAGARFGGSSSLLRLSIKKLDTGSGVHAAEELAAMPDAERPTAVFAANDLVAMGMLQGFVRRGIRVPDDVAIVGYDDIAFAAAAAVPLSSVRQPRTALGERAAALLFDEVEAMDNGVEHEHQHVRFAPELVIRSSSVVSRTPDLLGRAQG